MGVPVRVGSGPLNAPWIKAAGIVVGREAKQQTTDASNSHINHFFLLAFLLPMREVDLLGR